LRVHRMQMHTRVGVVGSLRQWHSSRWRLHGSARYFAFFS
jgi:hypothetical protein